MPTTGSPVPTIKLYNLSETDREDVFRVMDLNGDWRWYYDKKKDRYLPAVNAILDVGYPKDRRFHEYLLSVTKDEAKRILETAGERGARVHDAIQVLEQGQTLSFQQLLPNSLTGRPEPMTLEEWQSLLSWAQFVQDFKAEIVLCKHTVLGNGYAGTLDDVLDVTVPESAKRSHPSLVGKKLRVLVDYKTSGGIYPSYWAQVASYFMGDHGVPDVTHTAILRLGTSHKNGPIDGAGYEFKIRPVKGDGEEFTVSMDYAEFRCARRFWQGQSTPFKSEDMSASLPSSLTVSIPTTNPATIAKDPAGQSANGVGATEASDNVGQHISDTPERKEGVADDSGRILPSRSGGRNASDNGVHGKEGKKAQVPVRHPHGGRVRRAKAVPHSKSESVQQ